MRDERWKEEEGRRRRRRRKEKEKEREGGGRAAKPLGAKLNNGQYLMRKLCVSVSLW